MSEISQEAVAGVWPIEFGEAPITVVWPTSAAHGVGRAIGWVLEKLYALPILFRFLFAVVAMSLALGLYVSTRVLTWFARYGLTTLRVCARRGPYGKEVGQVSLSNLDEVRIVQRPGQAFYNSADLELLSGGRVVLTLAGVPNPETFRHNILAARDALLQVTACRRAQETVAAS